MSLNKEVTDMLNGIHYRNKVKHLLETGRIEERVMVLKESYDADYKTDSVHPKEPIPAGAVAKKTGTVQNFYGNYITVIYNDKFYYLNPENTKSIGYYDTATNKEFKAVIFKHGYKTWNTKLLDKVNW